MRTILLALIFIITYGQSVQTIKETVEFLADDKQEGRLAGTPEAKRCADFIVEKYKQYGLQPFEGKFLHPYSLKWVKTTKSSENKFVIDNITISNTEYSVAPFSASKKAEGEIVFVGYALKTPADSKFQYNSFVHTDLKDKIAMILEGSPTNLPDNQVKELLRYAYLKNKINNCAMRGAKAVIIIKDGKLPSFENTLAGSSMPIPIVYISHKEAKNILNKQEKDLDKIIKSLDKSTTPAKYNIETKAKAQITTKVIFEDKTDYNVVGAIYPENKENNKWIVVGGHYDHLDHGIEGSLARSPEERKQVHNGADDNASGTATVVALAEYFSKHKPKNYGILFCAWGGEELGLLGSNHWTKEHKKLPVVAYLNFDMVGRLDTALILQGLGSAEGLKDFCLNTAKQMNFPAKIKTQNDPYLPTDATSFYLIKSPVISFFTGIHEDYHRPTDDIEKINFEGATQIAQLARNIVEKIDAKEYTPEYKEFEKKEARRSAGPMRVYIGTMPDYTASDVDGMKISGVRKGSPADKGGLKGGDIIVKIGKTEIHNIYDYMFVLQNAKPGQKLKVIVIRNGKKKKLTVIPKAR